ncbi:MAG: RHS repeat-associated core domain-containing protein [Planctomycetaceae bacterium]
MSETLPTIWAGHHVDLDTGLTDMQARWRDTTSGVFLSEDPLSYGAGDTNLYRYAFNSPGNLVDPDGREPLSVVTYLGLTGISAGFDTLVEYGFTYFAGTQDEIDSFSWEATFAKNWALNIATAGIGNKLKYGTWLGKAGIGLARETTKRFLAREALEYTIDVGVGTGYDMYTRDESFSTAFGSNAVGSLIGKGVGHGLSAAGRAFPRLNPENYTWRTNTAGMFGGIEAEFDGLRTGFSPRAAEVHSNAGLILRYLKEIEANTGFRIQGTQRKALIKHFRENPDQIKFLSPAETDAHRWTSSKLRGLRKKWSKEHKQLWPTYTQAEIDSVPNMNGARQAGWAYDAHEIIPNQFNAPHEW